MLGRVRRTTRLDVGLALSFAGLSYLVWALVAGVSRAVVQEMIKSAAGQDLPKAAYVVKTVFVEVGIAINVVGLLWLLVSLTLVLLSSRQQISVSWSWVSAICQSFVAALGAVIVGWAAYQPHIRPLPAVGADETTWETVSSLSPSVLTAIAVAMWVTFVVWLLIERARVARRGPSLRDGLKSNIYR